MLDSILHFTIIIFTTMIMIACVQPCLTEECLETLQGVIPIIDTLIY